MVNIFYDSKIISRFENKFFFEKILFYKKSNKWKYLLNIPVNTILTSLFMYGYCKKRNIKFNYLKHIVYMFSFNSLYIILNEILGNIYIQKYYKDNIPLTLSVSLISSSIICLSYKSFRNIYNPKYILFLCFYLFFKDLYWEIQLTKTRFYILGKDTNKIIEIIKIKD